MKRDPSPGTKARNKPYQEIETMKITKLVIGRLVVGCVLALGLVANLQAQTYISAVPPGRYVLRLAPQWEAGRRVTGDRKSVV